MEETLPGFTLHHMGVAVRDFEPALAFYKEALGLRVVSGPFDDPIQKVSVIFLSGPGAGNVSIELIRPLNEDSPLNGYLKKEIGAYHLCYEVPDVVRAVADLRAKNCLTIAAPAPAVAFGGRKIAWCFTPTRHLIELLEQAAD
jgi:methylmalonyl-CoA/ethylmalonyl-CoA epimerase